MMATRPVRMLSGVDSVRAAHELLSAEQERRNMWPYPHIYSPPDSEDVFAVNIAATTDPAGGTPTVAVVTYQVPSGKRFFLRAVLLSVTGAASVIPGAGLWTVDRNKAIGVANVQGSVEHGLVNVPFPMGSNITGPWWLTRAREFEPLDIVRIKGTNVSLGIGAPNYWVCGLFGYEVPVVDLKPAK